MKLVEVKPEATYTVGAMAITKTEGAYGDIPAGELVEIDDFMADEDYFWVYSEVYEDFDAFRASDLCLSYADAETVAVVQLNERELATLITVLTPMAHPDTTVDQTVGEILTAGVSMSTLDKISNDLPAAGKLLEEIKHTFMEVVK